MNEIRIMRSFVAADTMAEIIGDEYDIGPLQSCKLFSKMLRTQDNDHYLVKTRAGEQMVIRVYQLGRHLERGRSDYEFELDWLRFLHQRGLPVSYPIPRRDGTSLGSIQAPEGERYYALFSFAKGKPMSLTDEEQLFQCGSEMARIHLVSNEFRTGHARKPMDLAFLVDSPVERMKRFWDSSQDYNLDLILTSAAEAKEEIEALLQNEEHTEDGWGPIGGDFHSANTHFDEAGQLTFFNFDLCGPGWRAYDIAVFLLNTNLTHSDTNMSEAFFAGYYSQRQLSGNEHAAVAPFMTLRRVWLTATFTMNEGLAGHTFIAPARPS